MGNNWTMDIEFFHTTEIQKSDGIWVVSANVPDLVCVLQMEHEKAYVAKAMLQVHLQDVYTELYDPRNTKSRWN